jgi:hypothetical protein
MNWRNATKSAVSCVVSYRRKCNGFLKIQCFDSTRKRDLVEHARLDIQLYCTNNFSARFVSSSSGDRMNLYFLSLWNIRRSMAIVMSHMHSRTIQRKCVIPNRFGFLTLDMLITTDSQYFY